MKNGEDESLGEEPKEIIDLLKKDAHKFEVTMLISDDILRAVEELAQCSREEIRKCLESLEKREFIKDDAVINDVLFKISWVASILSTRHPDNPKKYEEIRDIVSEIH